MSSRSNPRVLASLQVGSQVAAFAVAGVGLVVLAGATLHISELSRIANENAGIGFAFLAAGLALWILRDPSDTKPARIASHLFPSIVLVLGLLALGENLFDGQSTGLAMERSTATGLALVGAA